MATVTNQPLHLSLPLLMEMVNRTKHFILSLLPTMQSTSYYLNMQGLS